MHFIVLLEVGETDLWFEQEEGGGHQLYRANNHAISAKIFFGEWLISQGLWPPRSPDLS